MGRPRAIRKSVAAFMAATLFGALLSIAAAHAQESTIPSVDVVPADSSPEDPNGGQWFYLELAQGQSAAFRAFIRNPADVAQTVTLYLRDLEFTDDAPAIKEGPQTDIGAWGRADQSPVVVPPKGQVEASFSITIPRDAAPGDHIGAVVAESQPQPAGQFKVVLVAATRMYVTVPGEAQRGLEIESVKPELDSKLFPSRMTISAKIRNSGRVRLGMKVNIDDAPARGPAVLVSRHSEIYLAQVRVPFYGGAVSHPVEAEDTASGLIRRVNASTFVIPWGLLTIVAVAGLFGWGIKRWWERRASKLAKLQADIRRLETLVAQRPTGPMPDEMPDDQAQSETEALIAALKRARRTQSQASLERLALAFHESGNDALDVLLEALEKAGPERRRALAEAAASYGAAALLAHPRMERLNATTAADITLWASRDPNQRKPSGKSSDVKPPVKKAPRAPARARRKPPATRHKSKPKGRRTR